MSLRIWLPLTKDLKNQGLDDVTVTNNGATFNANGKLGGCYSFGTGNSYITIDSTPLKTFTEFSFACWVKIISWNTNYSTIFAVKNNTSVSWNNLIFSLLRDSSSSTLCFNISNGSNYTSNSCRTEALSLNTWYHITCTYKNGQIKLYQDGNIVSTYNTSVVPNFSSIVNLWIGKSNENSYQSNNLLNDVRIYDHCLSPLEVKQISQGLILHYPLNNNGWGQENLLINSYGTIIDKRNNSLNSRTEYFAWDVGNSYTDITVSTQVTISFDLEMYINDISSYGGQLQIYNTNNKGPVQIGNVSYFFKDEYSVGDTVNKRIYLSTNLIPRNDANKASNYIEFYTGYNSNNFYKISNVKLELGQKATPWCPNSADELAITLGLNDNIQYDTSGYGNNGAKIGSFSYDSDTPKYNTSTYAQGSASTYLEGIVLPSEAKTVSLWIKGAKTVNSAIFSDKTTGLQIGLLNSLLYVNCLASTKGFTTTHWKDNEWNHVVVINDNETRFCYVNGQAENQSGSTNYYIHNTDKFWLWKRSYNNNYSFKGNLSDLRIYCTALSAEDIKSLYNNSAYIDNQGNIYGAIYEEV